MNINFHYYAIKSIARATGIDEPDAQLLASYSQLVDDYDIYAPIIFPVIPDNASHLAEKTLDGKWRFYPVTTGFNSLLDMGRLLDETLQRYITVPFHFITGMSLEKYPKETPRENYRTRLAKHEDTSSLISMMLFDAKKRYGRCRSRENLMRIGTLLHIFADTYAHQRFSGFLGWENHSKVDEVTDLVIYKDITSQYNKLIYSRAPSIGHTNVYHAPDDTFVSFEIRLRMNEKDEYSNYYNRSNIQLFVIAAQQIHSYLADCFHLPLMNQERWDAFRRKLVQGFWLRENTIEQVPILDVKWKEIFPEFEFKYNPDPFKITDSSVYESAVTSGITENESNSRFSYTDDFFNYNIIAKEIRDVVNGKVTPFKTSNELLMASGS